MIRKKAIIYNQPLYYVPQYGGATKVSVLRVFEDGCALVVRRPKKDKNIRPFPVPLDFIFDTMQDACRGEREWEHWAKKHRKEKKRKNHADSE